MTYNIIVVAASLEEIVQGDGALQTPDLERHHATVILAGNLSNDVQRVGNVVLCLIDDNVAHKTIDIYYISHQWQKAII